MYFHENISAFVQVLFEFFFRNYFVFYRKIKLPSNKKRININVCTQIVITSNLLRHCASGYFTDNIAHVQKLLLQLASLCDAIGVPRSSRIHRNYSLLILLSILLSKKKYKTLYVYHLFYHPSSYITNKYALNYQILDIFKKVITINILLYRYIYFLCHLISQFRPGY